MNNAVPINRIFLASSETSGSEYDPFTGTYMDIETIDNETQSLEGFIHKLSELMAKVPDQYKDTAQISFRMFEDSSAVDGIKIFYERHYTPSELLMIEDKDRRIKAAQLRQAIQLVEESGFKVNK